jgi:Ca-activated chloride channel family protein
MLKQIILISDGQSNVGSNPVSIAELALDKGIIVNTIGIIDNSHNKTPIFELENIAEKGGGICELTDLAKLSETLSRVTIKSVYETVEEVVNNELKEILDMDMKEMKPSERYKFVKIIDKIGDEIRLKCLILLDISGSMKRKIDIARKSIFELLMFLEERNGESQIGVMVFPGKVGYSELLCDFTSNIDELRSKVEIIEVGGTTPTGPAIEEAIKIFNEEDYKYSINEHIV